MCIRDRATDEEIAAVEPLYKALNAGRTSKRIHTYATEGPEKPLFKLTKNGDHYELAVYGNIDKNLETPLFALSSMISSTPQAIYNAMYTVAQYDRTIMAQDYYKELGGSDVQITYTIVGDYDYFYYSIKQK